MEALELLAQLKIKNSKFSFKSIFFKVETLSSSTLKFVVSWHHALFMADLNCCTVCGKLCGFAHKCCICDKYVHAICGTGNREEEGYGQKIACFNCKQGAIEKGKTRLTALTV